MAEKTQKVGAPGMMGFSVHKPLLENLSSEPILLANMQEFDFPQKTCYYPFLEDLVSL